MYSRQIRSGTMRVVGWRAGGHRDPRVASCQTRLSDEPSYRETHMSFVSRRSITNLSTPIGIVCLLLLMLGTSDGGTCQQAAGTTPAAPQSTVSSLRVPTALLVYLQEGELASRPSAVGPQIPMWEQHLYAWPSWPGSVKVPASSLHPPRDRGSASSDICDDRLPLTVIGEFLGD